MPKNHLIYFEDTLVKLNVSFSKHVLFGHKMCFKTIDPALILELHNIKTSLNPVKVLFATKY
jgi:hypothetical protein